MEPKRYERRSFLQKPLLVKLFPVLSCRSCASECRRALSTSLILATPHSVLLNVLRAGQKSAYFGCGEQCCKLINHPEASVIPSGLTFLSSESKHVLSKGDNPGDGRLSRAATTVDQLPMFAVRSIHRFM